MTCFLRIFLSMYGLYHLKDNIQKFSCHILVGRGVVPRRHHSAPGPAMRTPSARATPGAAVDYRKGLPLL